MAGATCGSLFVIDERRLCNENRRRLQSNGPGGFPAGTSEAAMIIEMATSKEDMLSMRRIRQQVFEYEMGLTLPALSAPEGLAAAHVIARDELTGEPVAALTVVDTTNEVVLSEQYGLHLPPDARTARYTQLAVLKPYRGMNLPLRLILKAHSQFVAPAEFTHTWLLFDAKRAASSSLCARLGFSASERVFRSQYGVNRILVRDERSAFCEQAIRQTQQYLAAVAQKNGHNSHYDYYPLNHNHLTPDAGGGALNWREEP
jgi:hypothetical protein